MAAPTFVSETETAWNTATAPKTTASISVTSGDILVVAAATEDSGTTLATPTNSGTGLTWTLQQSIVVSNYCAVYVWTATASSTTSLTVSVNKTGFGTGWYGFTVYAFSGSDGVGVSAKQNNTSPPSLSTGTLTSANSALVSISADWSPVDATTRTWRSVEGAAATEGVYFRDASHYTVAVGHWGDTGTGTTAETVGLSAPASGWQQGTIVVEVRGAAAVNGSVTTTAPTVGFSVPTPDAGPLMTTTTAAYSTFEDCSGTSTRLYIDSGQTFAYIGRHTTANLAPSAGFLFRIPDTLAPGDVTAATLDLIPVSAGKFYTTVTARPDDAETVFSTATNAHPHERAADAYATYGGVVWDYTSVNTVVGTKVSSPDISSYLNAAMADATPSGGFYSIGVYLLTSTTATNTIQVATVEHASYAEAKVSATWAVPVVDGSPATTAPTVGVSVPTPTVSSSTLSNNVAYTNGASLAAKDTPDSGVRQIDIWTPGHTSAPSGGWPTLVWVHGGGWNSGVKENLAANGPHILHGALSRGFAVVVVDYRLTEPKISAVPNSGNEVTFPGPVHDVKVALRFLREDADGANTYNLNPDRTVLAGYSAGGQIVQFAAYSYGDTTTYEGVDTPSFDGTRPAQVNRSSDAAHYYYDFTQNSDGTWTPPTIKGLFLFAGVVNVREAINSNANTTARAANSDARRAYVNRHVFYDGSTYETNYYDELDVDHYIAGTASSGTSVTTEHPYYGKAEVVPTYPIGYAASTVDAQIPLASGYTALKAALTTVGYIGSDPTADVVYPDGLSYFPNSTLTHEQMEGHASVAASFLTWLDGIDTSAGADGSVTTTAAVVAVSVPTPGADAQFDGAITTTAAAVAVSVPTPGVSASSATTTTAAVVAVSVPTAGAAAQFDGAITTTAAVVAVSVPTPGAAGSDGSTDGSTTTTAAVVAVSVPTPGVSASGATTTTAAAVAVSVPTPSASAGGAVTTSAATFAIGPATPTIQVSSSVTVAAILVTVTAAAASAAGDYEPMPTIPVELTPEPTYTVGVVTVRVP